MYAHYTHNTYNNHKMLKVSISSPLPLVFYVYNVDIVPYNFDINFRNAINLAKAFINLELGLPVQETIDRDVVQEILSDFFMHVKIKGVASRRALDRAVNHQTALDTLFCPGRDVILRPKNYAG